MTMMLVIRRANELCAKNAVESFLAELTAKTDIFAKLDGDSWGQFRYYTLETELSRDEVSRAAHEILNTYDGAWNTQGAMKSLRRYLIVRCSIQE